MTLHRILSRKTSLTVLVIAMLLSLLQMFVAVAPKAGAAACPAEWVATKAYTGGQQAAYSNKAYEAKWWTQGDRPDQSTAYGPWKLIGDCGPDGGNDTAAPTAPANLTSTAKTSSSVALSWTASTDNVGVTGYTVYNGTAAAVTVTATTATVTGLAANTAYTFTVKAKDAAGNTSAASNAVTVTTTGGDPDPVPNKIVGAYVASWHFPNVNTVPANKLTHVFYAFANLSNNTISGGDTNQIAQLVTLKSKNPSLKVLISVGGWGNSAGFSPAASSDANRTAFANSAVQYLRANKLDGIDLDWEYPAASDKANYTLLLQKLRQTLDTAGAADGKRYLITAATGASASGIVGIDLAAVQQYFDFINIMTYDMQTGNGAHHTNLYTSSRNTSYSVKNAVDLYKASGLPANKIVIGGAFYSHGAGDYTYDELLASYINKNGWTRQWDDTAKAPYLTNASGGFLSYDDEQSLTEKVNYLKANSLAGIMFWEYGQNLGGQLLESIYTAIK